MKVLKGFAVGLLSFLLFWSLSALGLAIMLNLTILNPDFIIAELDKSNAYTLVKEQIISQIPQATQAPPQLKKYIDEAVNAATAELEPWLKEQVKNAIYTSYDYFKGKTDKLSIEIPTAPIKQSLKDNLWKAFQKSPPPELASLPPAMVKQFFDQIYDQEISKAIPPTIELSKSMLSPETMEIIDRVRFYLSYFDMAFKGLMGLTALLIVGIILINREVRASIRGIGVTFLSYGIPGYGGTYAAKYFAGLQVAQANIPAQFQAFIPQLIGDIMSPLQMFSLAILITGVVLIIIPHIYKPRRAIS